MIAAFEERLARRDLRGKGLEGKGDAEWKKFMILACYPVFCRSLDIISTNRSDCRISSSASSVENSTSS
jgi:hypothetical protein